MAAAFVIWYGHASPMTHNDCPFHLIPCSNLVEPISVCLSCCVLPLTGNFRAGEESGTIMKKSDANERNALRAIMGDVLRSYAPEFKKVVEQDDGSILPHCFKSHTHTFYP